MATILETINTVTDKIVSLVGTRANKDLSNLTALGEAKLVSGTSGLPVGTVIAYMGTDVPTGYLLMDGRTLSRTTYAALFKVIGTTQGAGDGKTTFGIADMTDGRYLMGSTVAGGSINAFTISGTVYGNGKGLGLSNGTYTFTPTIDTDSQKNRLNWNRAGYGTAVGSVNTISYVDSPNATTFGVVTDPAYSGLVCSVSIPKTSTTSSSLSTMKLGKFLIKYKET